MSLRGLPDFDQPLHEGSPLIFAPFEISLTEGSCWVVPDQLELAARADGQPAFTVELVRVPPTRKYGVLDCRLGAQTPLDAALAWLRQTYGGGTVKRAGFRGGWLRFLPAGADLELPPELAQPQALDWQEWGQTRWVMKVTAETALLLRQALQSETLLFSAVAELELTGVAARLPLRVRGDAGRLLTTLHAQASAELLEQAALVRFFKQEPGRLPLEVVGALTEEQRPLLAEALADRVRAQFATAVPAPAAPVSPYLKLNAPDTVAGALEWDLAQPVATARTFVVPLHPLAAARQFVREHGLAAVFLETTVPALATGTHTIELNLNMPAEMQGVLALGVTLRAAPHPPQRVQAATATAQFKADADAAAVQLRLAPTEPLAYSYTTFLLLRQGLGMKRLEGALTPSDATLLTLNPSDFAAQFIPVEASADLLELATLAGVCRWQENGAPREQRFTLGPQCPAVTLVLPPSAQATLTLEARERGGARTLALGPWPAAAVQLGRFSFVEFGLHALELTCELGASNATQVFEFLPEGCPETTSEITTLQFTRAQPQRTLTWFAASPFAAGFRYRPRRRAGEPPAEWSAVCAYDKPLTLHSQ